MPARAIRLLLTGALLGMLGCVGASIESEATSLSLELPAAPGDAGTPLPRSDLNATRIAEGWFEQSHGFDGLEAYEIAGPLDRFDFAVARKWDGRTVKVLFYITEPKVLDEVSVLILREPDRPRYVFAYMTPQLYDWLPPGVPLQRGRVVRMHANGSLANGSANQISREATHLFLPGDFEHVRLADQRVAGEVCSVIESRPATHMRGLTRMELFVSQRTGVPLRTVYYQGNTELRRVTVSPEDVHLYGARWLPTHRKIRTADGTEAELVLRNLVQDAPLPDRLFTRRTLREQSFPSF